VGTEFQGQAADFDKKQADAEELCKTPLFTRAEVSVDRFLDSKPPDREYLLEDVLPCAVAGAIVAPGGTGKSQWMLQLAASVATGESLCGVWRVAHQGQVLCLMAEDDEFELHRRVWDTLHALPVEVQDRARRNLFVRSLVGENNKLTERLLPGEVAEAPLVRRLRVTLKQFKNLKLVVIDPASRFRGGEENNAMDVTRFVEVIEALVKETGATILVVHHTNKTSASNIDSSQNDSRGSSAFVDGVRFVMVLKRMSRDEAGEFGIDVARIGFYLRAEVVKNNYAPPQSEPIWLERGEGGVLRKADIASLAASKRIERAHRIFARIQSERAMGRLYTATAFAKEFGGKNREFGIGREAMVGELKELVVAGVLVQRQPSTEEKKLFRLHRNVRDLLNAGNLESLGAPNNSGAQRKPRRH
jgi:RecA-family ATPase